MFMAHTCQPTRLARRYCYCSVWMLSMEPWWQHYCTTRSLWRFSQSRGKRSIRTMGAWPIKWSKEGRQWYVSTLMTARSLTNPLQILTILLLGLESSTREYLRMVWGKWKSTGVKPTCIWVRHWISPTRGNAESPCMAILMVYCRCTT